MKKIAPLREFQYTEHEKQCAQIVDQLCPVFVHHTKAHVGPDCFKSLVLRLAELLPDTTNEKLDIFLMTDQPPTCPECGLRVVCLSGCGESKQIVRCMQCGFKYRLEAE